MSRAEPELVVFRLDDRTPVIEAMRAVAPSSGWIMLQPGVDPEAAAAYGGRPGLFSARGPMIPVCTWVPGERTRRGNEYTAVGIEHASGPKAVARLVERGTAVPDRWVVLQDNPRRGLVVAVPVDEMVEDVLDWLLDAAAALSDVPFTGEWRAVVYRRR